MFSLIKILDVWLFRLINEGLENPALNRICPLFNNLKPFIPLILLGLGWLLWRKSPRAWTMALLLVLGVLLGDLCVFNPLKSIIARPRPAASLKHVHELASGATGGNSFPSSHTANAFIAAAVLSFFYPHRRLAFLLAAGFVGFTRVYVGVHYPSDIVGSAILGWVMGQGVLLGYRKIIPFFNGKKRPSFHSPKWPGGLLFLLQIVRLVWCIRTDLDPPPACLRLWSQAMKMHVPTFLGALGRAWFGIFEASSLSLWLIPWTFQTLWISLLGWLAWKRGKLAALWGIALMALFLPLVSQLSFLGSPSLVFQEGDWTLPHPILALFFYLLLALPAWIAAICIFPRHPISSGMAMVGLILAVSLPGLYWQFLAMAVIGLLLDFAEEIGAGLSKFGSGESAKARLLLIAGVLYGFVLSIAVYNPLFMRKMGISILPRNSPLYTQTGWSEWAARVRPILAQHHAEEVWSDSEMSRDQLQYLLGRDCRVTSPRQVMKNWSLQEERSPILPPRYYVREIYFAQIHPQVIYLRRDDWLPRSMQKRMLEIETWAVFRHGDPIRQFQLFMLDPE